MLTRWMRNRRRKKKNGLFVEHSKQTRLFLLLELLLHVFILICIWYGLCLLGSGFHSKELVSLPEIVSPYLRVKRCQFTAYGSKHVLSMTLVKRDVHQAVKANSYAVTLKRSAYRLSETSSPIEERGCLSCPETFLRACTPSQWEPFPPCRFHKEKNEHSLL